MINLIPGPMALEGAKVYSKKAGALLSRLEISFQFKKTNSLHTSSLGGIISGQPLLLFVRMMKLPDCT